MRTQHSAHFVQGGNLGNAYQQITSNNIVVNSQQPSIFSYNENNVSFKIKNESVFVNATEMAKPFGNEKRPQFWINNQNTSDFLNAIGKARNLALTDLVQVRKGGKNSGTWMHEDVALEFARWLSPSFAIWCNDRIKELLKFGFTATQQTLEDLINNPDLVIQLAYSLKTERENNERLRIESEEKQKQIQKLEPKARYTDEVLQSTSTFTTTQMADDLGMSAKTLNKKLESLGVIYKQSGQWHLKALYKDKGYTDIRVSKYTVGEEIKTAQSLVWTELGRVFLNGLRNNGQI